MFYINLGQRYNKKLKNLAFSLAFLFFLLTFAPTTIINNPILNKFTAYRNRFYFIKN